MYISLLELDNRIETCDAKQALSGLRKVISLLVFTICDTLGLITNKGKQTENN